MKEGIYIALLFAGITLTTSCSKTEELIDFTEEDEIMLGERLTQYIEENATYFFIPEEGNSLLYGYVNTRLQEIISSSPIMKSENYQWRVRIYESDTRHAFAHPGGSLFVSTGMIFYIDNEDQFSGLLAHLIAHLNQSHITERLFFKYGVNGLKSIAQSGDEEAIGQIVDDLDLSGNYITLSRAHELQADTLTVSMLSEGTQSCQASGLFLSRVLNVQPNQLAAFISIHDLTQERVDAIEETTISSGCDSSVDAESASRFRSFRNAIP